MKKNHITSTRALYNICVGTLIFLALTLINTEKVSAQHVTVSLKKGLAGTSTKVSNNSFVCVNNGQVSGILTAPSYHTSTKPTTPPQVNAPVASALEMEPSYPNPFSPLSSASVALK